MKVAVSIPDAVFEEADALAARLRTTRSDVYARALAAYVGEHDTDRVTEAMNDVVDAVGASRDEFTRAAARRVLDRSEW
jgi:metal-responsive CopG/Arc/MetJ family transcriptional regulator